MSDKKTQADDRQAKATGKAQTTGTMSFPEMMEKMMAGPGAFLRAKARGLIHTMLSHAFACREE